MRKLVRIPTALLSLGIIMAAVPLAALPATAASGTLYVSATGTNAGGNNCQTQSNPCATISYAVSKAASGDTIQVAAGTYHDIVVIAPPLTGITISGPSGGATVDGVSTTAQIGSVFTVEDGSNATIKNLTITNGEGALFTNGGVSTTYGNGVFVSQGATATLSNDNISGNEDGRGTNVVDDGGGVYNGGTLVMNNDTVSGNGAPAGMFDGGGIFTASGTSTTLNDDTFSGNVAADAGGAIYNGGTTTLNDDTLSANLVEFTELGANAGGGVYNDLGTVHLHADTLVKNEAGSGSAVFTNAGTTTDLAGTIFDGNAGFECSITTGSTWSDSGYNLSDDNTCSLSNSTSLSSTNPNLGPLASNGGPTQTYLPAAGSPAIDEIPNPTTADGFSLCPGTDQRGTTRPQGSKCDIGSVEVQEAAGPKITKVSFAGDTAKPEVTITGHGFGSKPAAFSDNTTSCGQYTKNGADFGPTNLWFEDVGHFVAGQGIPPNGACIGIRLNTWSSTKVVIRFGSAYDSFDHWFITAGDSFVLSLKGVQASGVVSFG
jgi:hypothetical protein